MSAKRREAFLKIIAGSSVHQLDTERAAAQPIETINTGSHYSPRPSDEQITLAEIKDMLIGLSEKVNRLERKISNMDICISEGLNLLNETKFVETEEYLLENEANFYEGMDDKDWNTYYEEKLAKSVNFFINSITFALC
ncbi:hypothetical protein F8M41_012611 [Gigaspora margarita]|uniref:Uncharacterized protein n=1 Tax=Gigaspora margarita TaxID=4874 RepID=A0A8H4ASU0_GIGMA|nr:hypothetical protein F8M41_012611 [Gigaspora margarita]